MTPNQSLDTSIRSETSISSTKETISTTIKRDAEGSPGFAVAGGKGITNSETIVISSITPGGAAERDGKLRVGDRVLSVGLKILQKFFCNFLLFFQLISISKSRFIRRWVFKCFFIDLFFHRSMV